MKSVYLEPSTIEALKLHTSEHAWLPLWLSLETGLRVGDVVALKVNQVKRDGIHYTAQKTGKKGIAPISHELRKKLNKKGKYLFPSPQDPTKHLTRQAVWARIKAAAHSAGIDLKGVSPHSLRKSFAVELYREKGFEAVKKALQHNNAATTEIYSFADFNTGENADLPLKRRDLQLIVKMCLEALGDLQSFTKESEQKKNRLKKDGSPQAAQ